MPGLVPGIHVFPGGNARRGWMTNFDSKELDRALAVARLGTVVAAEILRRVAEFGPRTARAAMAPPAVARETIAIAVLVVVAIRRGVLCVLLLRRRAGDEGRQLSGIAAGG